jgi:antitoxin MazE
MYIIKESAVRVAKWGNSLAVRLPAAMVKALSLSEGDEVEVNVTPDKALSVSRDDLRQAALERIAARRWQLPKDWKFDREEANSRD